LKNEHGDTPIGVKFLSSEKKMITKSVKEFKKKMKDIKDKRKTRNIIPRMVICPIDYTFT
jgi:hypothetical protein